MRDGDWGVLTYEFPDVVKTLSGIYSYDWATFLKTRIQTPGQPSPLQGIEAAGYRLVWKLQAQPLRPSGRRENAKTTYLA